LLASSTESSQRRESSGENPFSLLLNAHRLGEIDRLLQKFFVVRQDSPSGLALPKDWQPVLKTSAKAAKVDYEVEELLRQRIIAIACGYEDANDAPRLGSDPVHKLLVGCDPEHGKDLASQPTLSRFEN
jgi:hypothetical protein